MISETFMDAVVSYIEYLRYKCEDKDLAVYTVPCADPHCLPEEQQDMILKAYNRLWDEGRQIEAYILLRVAFGHISMSKLLHLHNKHRLLRQADIDESISLF